MCTSWAEWCETRDINFLCIIETVKLLSRISTYLYKKRKSSSNFVIGLIIFMTAPTIHSLLLSLSLPWQPSSVLTSSSSVNDSRSRNNRQHVVAGRNVDHHLQCQFYTTEIHAKVSCVTLLFLKCNGQLAKLHWLGIGPSMHADEFTRGYSAGCKIPPPRRLCFHRRQLVCLLAGLGPTQQLLNRLLWATGETVRFYYY